MKFIFPQNYNFRNKLFGVIEYSTIFINIFWDIFIFILISIFNSINIKIFLFVILSFPVLLLSFSGFNGENITYVIKYVLKFLFKQKIYFFQKNNI